MFFNLLLKGVLKCNSSKYQIDFLKYSENRNNVNFLTTLRQNILYITVTLKQGNREITVRH